MRTDRTPLQRFLEILDREKSHGYTTCHSERQFNAIDDSMWEFRVAINPEPENLDRAARLLAPIFHRHGLQCKFLLLTEREGQAFKNVSPASIGWDGTQVGFEHASDRDQRGKECCVYVRFRAHSAVAEKTPDELKAIMLEAWKALQNPNIRYGYAATPVGDKAIMVKDVNLPSPFSYTANKPWRGRHGILSPQVYQQQAAQLLAGTTQEYDGHINLAESNPDPRQQFRRKRIQASALPEHNPLCFADPFAGIEFTLQDLADAGVVLLKELDERYRDLQMDYTIKNAIHQQRCEFLSTVEKTSTLLQVLNIINESFNASLNQLPDLTKRQLEYVCFEWPRTPDMSLREWDIISQLKYAVEQQNIAEVKGIVTELLSPSVQASVIKEIDTIKQEVSRFFSPDRVDPRPATAQLFYRHAVHLENQKLAKEKLKTQVEACSALNDLIFAMSALDLKNKQEAKLYRYLAEMQKNLRQLLVHLNPIAVRHQDEDDRSLADATRNIKRCITKVSEYSLLMVQRIKDKRNNRNIKLIAINDFEKSVKNLANSMQELPASTMSAKKIQLIHHIWSGFVRAAAGLLIAAAGAVIGGVIGAVVEGSIMAIASAQIGGALGVVGVVQGAIKGSITGWAYGLMAASAAGLMSGAGTGYRLFKTTNLDEIRETSAAIARKHLSPKQRRSPARPEEESLLGYPMS